MAQIDLFLIDEPAPRAWLGETPEAQAQRGGWEARCLREMGAGPVVYCYPGFMGSHHERLVAQGLAERQAAGFLAPPEGLNARALKAWGWNSADHPLFRYTLTDAGRARL